MKFRGKETTQLCKVTAEINQTKMNLNINKDIKRIKSKRILNFLKRQITNRTSVCTRKHDEIDLFQQIKDSFEEKSKSKRHCNFIPLASTASNSNIICSKCHFKSAQFPQSELINESISN